MQPNSTGETVTPKEQAAQAIEPLFVNVPEAATALRQSRSALYQLLDSGELESVKVGRRRLIPTQALKDYADRLRTLGAAS